MRREQVPFFFFFNDTATTEIYTLSLHDALPISHFHVVGLGGKQQQGFVLRFPPETSDGAVVGAAVYVAAQDRKSTRLNSSHGYISYAVFCLKKKKQHDRVRPVIRS